MVKTTAGFQWTKSLVVVSFTFDERDLMLIYLKWYTLVTKCMHVGSPSRRFCLILLNVSFYGDFCRQPNMYSKLHTLLLILA